MRFIVWAACAASVITGWAAGADDAPGTQLGGREGLPATRFGEDVGREQPQALADVHSAGPGDAPMDPAD